MTDNITSLDAFRKKRQLEQSKARKSLPVSPSNEVVWNFDKEQLQAVFNHVGQFIKDFKEKTGIDFKLWNTVEIRYAPNQLSPVLCFYNAIKPTLDFHVARTGKDQYSIHYLEGATINYDSLEEVLTYIGQIYDTVSKQIADNHTRQAAAMQFRRS